MLNNKIILYIIIYFLLRKSYSCIAGIAFSFILGGALGNLCDRIIAGKVTDFIDLNRKMLSQIAVLDTSTFQSLIES